MMATSAIGTVLLAGIAIVGINHIVSIIECAVADSKVQDSYSKEEAVEAIEAITGNDTVDFQGNNVKITDSYKVTSRYKRIYISKIIQNTVNEDGHKYTNRGTYSLAAEWAGHNFLSRLNIRPESTDDVNLDYDFNNNALTTKIGTIALMILGYL